MRGPLAPSPIAGRARGKRVALLGVEVREEELAPGLVLTDPSALHLLPFDTPEGVGRQPQLLCEALLRLDIRKGRESVTRLLAGRYKLREFARPWLGFVTNQSDGALEFVSPYGLVVSLL